MVKIEGRESLRRKFRAMPEAVRAEVKKAIPSSANELVGMMQRLAPRDKGNLIASIHAEQTEEFKSSVIAGGTAATRREVRKGSGVFTDEVILVEFGSKAHKAGGKFAGATIPAIPARPFFWPSFRALRKRAKSRISRSITTGIKKIANNGR